MSYQRQASMPSFDVWSRPCSYEQSSTSYKTIHSRSVSAEYPDRAHTVTNSAIPFKRQEHLRSHHDQKQISITEEPTPSLSSAEQPIPTSNVTENPALILSPNEGFIDPRINIETINTTSSTEMPNLSENPLPSNLLFRAIKDFDPPQNRIQPSFENTSIMSPQNIDPQFPSHS